MAIDEIVEMVPPLGTQNDAVVITPEKAAVTDKVTEVSYLKIFSLAERLDILFLLIGIVGAVGNGLLFPIFSITFGQFTNTFGAMDSTSFNNQVQTLALQFTYIAVAALVASYLEATFWLLSGNNIVHKLRELYLKAAMRQDVAYFDVAATTGGLLQGLNEDGNLVQAAVSDKTGLFIHNMTTFLAGFGIAFFYGWDMTLVMAGCIPFLALVGFLFSNVITTMEATSTKAYTRASTVVQQTLAQIRTVAAYGQEDRALQEFTECLDEPLKIGIKQNTAGGLTTGMFQFVVYNTYAVGFFYGAHRISAGVYTGGQVLIVLLCTLLGGFSLGQAAPSMQIFIKGRAACSRMYKVIESKPVITADDPNATKLETVEGEVEFRDVWFSYPARPDVQVFKGFSLSVAAGHKTALVGSSGSGKSTAVSLLERFYDPQQGAVFVDGHDLRTLNLTHLRRHMGLVSQEPTLFATTIYENVAMGKPGATREEVMAAVEAANAAKFLSSLPEGYETQVGERGLQLSGGQKQRIAIARAILKNPKILCLDEATSALDVESEAAVQAALDRLVVGRTTVVIAHRLSTIRDADKIAVVVAGQVVEEGTHEELLSNPVGEYSTLVKLQVAAGIDKEGDMALVADNTEYVEQMPFVQAEKDGRASMEARPGTPPTGAKDKKKDEEAEPKVKIPMSELLKLNRPEWGYGAIGCVASFASGCQNPAFAYCISQLIFVLYSTDMDYLLSQVSFYCWMLFVIAVGTFISMLVTSWAFGVMGQHLAMRLRTQLFKSILHQEISWFDLPENASGKLTAGLATDATYVRGAVGDVLGLILSNTSTLALGYVIALIFDWQLALLITGVLPLLAGSSIIQMRIYSGMSGDNSKAFNDANQAVGEAFSSARIIHAYNLQDFVLDLYRRLAKGPLAQVNKMAHVTGLVMGCSFFIMFGMYGLIMWFSGWQIAQGMITFQDMLLAFLSILIAAMGMAMATMQFPDMGKASAAVQRIFPIINRPSLTDSADPKGIADVTVEGCIEFQHVTFAYPTRASVNVFSDFNLTIPAKQQLALVGESGSGKSTVIGLIERFYEPSSGQVLLDGVHVSQYRISFLRAQMALVSQEPLLFATSILENIRYGRAGATVEEVRAAAAAANALDFIGAMPEGLETLVGEGGIQLSGGQKQRIAIARAVLKDPKVLLLDEATSALDAVCEAAVQTALDAIMPGRTAILIAHRLSTIRNVHSIAVVHRGKLLEIGTHTELSQKPGGMYARLLATQNRQRSGVSSPSIVR